MHSDVGGGYQDKGIGDITWDFMMRQAARRGLVIDPAQPTPPVELEAASPIQHESFDAKWEALSNRLHLLPQAVRPIGLKVTGPRGESLTAAGEVRFHPSLVSRLGQRSPRSSTRTRNARREGDYRPANVVADALPVFA